MNDLIRAKARRLHQLKLRRALQGYETPPHVDLEIEDIEGVARRGIDMATPRWFDLYIVISASGVSAALIIGVLDFILILVLWGK